MRILVLLTCLLAVAYGRHVPKQPSLIDLEYGIGRIVGGRPAEEGEFPSQVSLLYGGLHNCGGTIISDTWVVTAAHCVRLPLPGLISVQAGTNNWNSGGTHHQAVTLIDHPGFNWTDFSSQDIGLIEVTPPFEFNNVTQPASLPVQEQETPGGSPAMIVGWGLLSDNSTLPPLNLQAADVIVRDHQVCYDIYLEEVPITDAQICADVEEGGVGVCSGDSGGPLYVGGQIVGVTSWSANGCAAQGYPGVFTRVASYRDWILENSGV